MNLSSNKNGDLLCVCGNNYFEEVKLRRVNVTHLVNWAAKENKKMHNIGDWGQEIPRGERDGTSHVLKCCSCGKIITAVDVRESELEGDD